MILVIGHVTARSDTLDELLRISIEHVLRSRAEPGCLSHEVSRDAQNPLRLTFVERWADRAALQVHFEVEASRSFGKALARGADGAPDMQLYESQQIDPTAMLARQG
jgi:quinol monooxygenase YgiN